MDLIYLIKSLLRKKWLIIISTILAVLLAFVLTINEKRLYRSVAQLATGFTTTDQVKLKTDEGFNIYEIDVKFNNVTEAFRSSKVLSMLSYSVMLHDLETPSKAFRKLTAEEKEKEGKLRLSAPAVITVLKEKYSSETLLSSYNPEERKILELIKLYKYDLESIKKMLFVGRVQRTDYLDVEYNSSNPELSAYMVNQGCAEFLRNNESSRTQQNSQSIETLAKLSEQKKEVLDGKIQQLRLKGGVDVSVESTSKLTQVSTFEVKLSDEKTLLNSSQLGLADVVRAIGEMDRTNAATVAAPSTASADLIRIRNERDAAFQEYQNKGSNDKELFNKYQRLKTEYQNKAASMNSAGSAPASGGLTRAQLQQKKSELEIQIKTSQQNIYDLERKIASLNAGVYSAASRNADNMAMQKELDLAQSEYENVKSRYDAAMNNKVAPMDDFRQILFGQPAVEPEPSKRLIILGLAGMTMFVFCCIAIIFLEYIDVSIKTPSQYLKIIDLKQLSVINKLNLKKGNLNDIFDSADQKNKASNTFREHIRKLRYEIEKSGHKIFLITSARPQEGKSTIIKALSHSFSVSKKKVLIIDTNFPNNTLTKEFEAAENLEGFSAPDNNVSMEKLRKIISKTSIEHVDIIGSKGGDYTPAEVLGENNVLNYLPLLTTEYDFIFMEGPALNNRADSKELLRYADTVISVVSARSTIKQTDKETIAFLQGLNGKYTGAILNYVELENIDL
ncbi:Wzz/FepE/Etk N-terminal domain-containing protein [uncultured Chitinophaga sp.]|uniref:exopolysaccharide transport family protein n=1 Tax=uncultured Chitinophaga sp. TaxID=339340 RepID=UPI0025DB97C3|nr:Wzz/FepE/Etk N-terminal domain-containing protein [uncultured Chitinophaga sp.]